jgi:hypothetical protein
MNERTIPQGSSDFQRRNPHLFGLGGLVPTEPQQDNRKTLAAKSQTSTGRPRSMGKRRPFLRVGLIRISRGTLDSDNLRGSLKPLRDAIAASLCEDDNDRNIRWDYGQLESTGKPGVIVKMERIA